MIILKNFRRLSVLLLVTLTTVFSGAAFAQAVTVVEFYNKTLDAYFITGRTAEQQTLDGQADFRRTGMTFDAFTASAFNSAATRICRFYISMSSPFTSSHFYGRDGVDCQQLQAQSLTGFTYEGFDFSVAEPTGGVCPAGTTAIYRGFRAAAAGKTPNHRYTTSLATYDAAKNDGYAPENTVFCASSATDVVPTVESTQKCGTFYYSGQLISYQSLTSDGTSAGFKRFLDKTNSTFNGRTDAKAVVESVPGNSPLSTLIVDGTTNWILLGTSRITDGGYDEVYYSNPTVYPRSFAQGQQVSVDSQLTYSRANGFGNVTEVGKVTYIGKESVTVPLGTYVSACKFVTQLVTTYSGTGQSTTTSITDWVADALGIVKNVTDTYISFPSSPVVNVTTTTEAVFAQPR